MKKPKFPHPNLTDPSTKKTTIFEALFLKVTSHFFVNLLPGRKVTPPPKSVFHSCIWPSESLANARELDIEQLRDISKEKSCAIF